ncbi:MAG TPA: cell wall-binding repeat-containing protein [Dermatophilaceae bacterium]|nr:cell wall-binding repeat-containing protein [Dermatophilaceae bacterium]
MIAAATTTTATTTTATTAGWVLHGAGWGHGLGMSQYGAWEMAKDGYTASQILAHYYSGTTYDAVTDDQVLNVNIINGATSVTATSSALLSGGGGFTVTVGAVAMTGAAGDSVTFTRPDASSVKADCATCSGATSLTGASATLAWDSAADATLIDIGGTNYRDGSTEVTPTPGSTSTTLNVVNKVKLHDEYLDYLREMPWSWSTEALKAQAAAARSYALRRLAAGIQSVCNCHLYDTARDQVYGGYPSDTDLPYWSAWKNAVSATGTTSSGYVARANGSTIEALYMSSSGGRTENNEDVWGGTAIPYLRGVDDPWSLRPSNPNAAWKQVTIGSAMASAFGLPDVVRLDLRDRTGNGGIKSATATSSTGATATITGEAFRGIATTSAAPYTYVKSTAIRHLTQRFSGADRYAVAAAVAASVAPNATSVVLAGGATLPDASVSGPLAATLDAPLLLTGKSSLPAATVAELNRRGSLIKTAYVVGGTGVVSDTVVSQLKSRGLTVQRIAGVDRYDTSAKVASQITARRTVSAVVIAGGLGLPDALGASGPASALVEPILLTPASGLASATRSGLTATGAKTARIVGGTAVVSTTVESQLTSLGVAFTRLSGSNRYATSSVVASFYRPLVPNTSEIVLTSGADANLVDSLVAGTRQRLMALTQPSSLVETAATTLESTPLLETVSAVGGTSAVYALTLTAAANS